uniref:Uncharacterized protein n=1 Tax=Lygus hesperus TaxID=30085 RepID=A0A146KUB6_LYGHE
MYTNIHALRAVHLSLYTVNKGTEVSGAAGSVATNTTECTDPAYSNNNDTLNNDCNRPQGVDNKAIVSEIDPSKAAKTTVLVDNKAIVSEIDPSKAAKTTVLVDKKKKKNNALRRI